MNILGSCIWHLKNIIYCKISQGFNLCDSRSTLFYLVKYKKKVSVYFSFFAVSIWISNSLLSQMSSISSREVVQGQHEVTLARTKYDGEILPKSWELWLAGQEPVPGGVGQGMFPPSVGGLRGPHSTAVVLPAPNDAK